MRCFVGYRLPSEVQEVLACLQHSFPLENMTLVNPHNIHITLNFFGELSEEKVFLMQERMKKLSFEPFEAHLGEIGFFSHVVYVAVEPENRFHSLHSTLQALLHEADFKEEERFRCHATIARIKKGFSFSEYLKHIPVPSISFMVSELSFLHSTLTREGPIYREICRISST